jgi:hypothetical protein
MTKEQFERAKEITKELIHLQVAIDSFKNQKLIGSFEDCKVDLRGVVANYKKGTLALLRDRKKILEKEFKTL